MRRDRAAREGAEGHRRPVQDLAGDEDAGGRRSRRPEDFDLLYRNPGTLMPRWAKLGRVLGPRA